MGQLKKKILVVEDEPYQQVIYKEELQEFFPKYKVVVASNGIKALEEVDKGNVECTVSDIKMGGMTGIELVSEILTRDRKIPVIFNTAYETYKDDFMTWAADAYIVKSADLTKLKDTIQYVLSNR